MTGRRAVSANLSLVCFAFALAVFGCQKSADQPSSSSTPDAAAPGNPGNPAPSAANQPAPKPLPRPPQPIIVPAATVISVVLDQAIGSKISTPGQAFSATVQVPIEVDGKLAIPKGARASGFVKDAKPAGRFKGGAALSLILTSITVKNQDYDIQTTAPTENSTGKGKRTAGTGGAGFAGKRDITLAAETPLTFKLLDALEIKRRR